MGWVASGWGGAGPLVYDPGRRKHSALYVRIRVCTRRLAKFHTNRRLEVFGTAKISLLCSLFNPHAFNLPLLILHCLASCLAFERLRAKYLIT